MNALDRSAAQAARECDGIPEPASHTQGPWRVSDSNGHGDLFIAAEGDRNALVVAQMLPPFPGEHAFGCVRANANLIAACPALLEACKLVASLGDPTADLADRYGFINAQRMARAAIAKATGE